MPGGCVAGGCVAGGCVAGGCVAGLSIGPSRRQSSSIDLTSS